MASFYITTFQKKIIEQVKKTEKTAIRTHSGCSVTPGENLQGACNQRKKVLKFNCVSSQALRLL
jgi:hypothetical protein